MPQTIGEKMTMAKSLVESGLMPPALNTAQKVFVSLQWGHELGLSPMVAVNSIAVINNKPTLSADIMYALVRASPEYGGSEWVSMDANKAEVKITRKSAAGSETFRGYFDMKMAVEAGLASKPVWKACPARMLKHRALSYALRDAFPDVLAGIYTPEEMYSAKGDDVYRNVTPEAPETSDITQNETTDVEGKSVVETATIVNWFSQNGVSAWMIERYIKHRIEEMTEADMKELSRVAHAISAGDPIDDYFEVEKAPEDVVKTAAKPAAMPKTTPYSVAATTSTKEAGNGILINS
jgi:hypothetical protein